MFITDIKTQGSIHVPLEQGGISLRGIRLDKTMLLSFLGNMTSTPFSLLFRPKS